MDKIEIIKSKITMHDILLHYGIKPNCGMFIKCISHSEKTPSMKIYPNNTCHCWGCGFDCDVIGFVAKMQNVGYSDAINYIDEVFRLGLKTELSPKELRQIQEHKKQAIQQEQSDRADARAFLDNFKAELPLTKEERNKFILDWISEAKAKRLVEASKPIDEHKEQRHKIIAELRKVERLLDHFDLSNPQDWSDNRMDSFMALKKKQTELDESYWKLC